MVDKSLVRSGRFDVKINIPLPSLSTKLKIFEKYLNKTKSRIGEGFAAKLL
jgi:SpoVK/Ycf46/Vps4 family AAA+-type ATPase